MEKYKIEQDIFELARSQFDDLNENEAIAQMRQQFDLARRVEHAKGLTDIKLKWDSEYGYQKLMFVGYREETDSEFLKRTDKDKWAEDETRKRDYREYLRLKKIFETVDSK